MTHLNGIANGSTETTQDKDGSISTPKSYRPSERVEPAPKPNFPHHLYPRWIGHKFSPDGKILSYPGNGVLSPLDPTSLLHRSLHALLDDIKKQGWASLYTFLPPSSWHMTTYEGISNQIRAREQWPAGLPVDSSLKACHAHVATQLADLEHGLSASPLQIKVAGFESLADGIALRLVPVTSEGEHALRDLRDRLSERLGTRHPGHDQYSFHMGMGYLLRSLSEEDEAKITKFLEGWQSKLPDLFELAIPEFCVYDDMYAFQRVFSLE